MIEFLFFVWYYYNEKGIPCQSRRMSNHLSDLPKDIFICELPIIQKPVGMNTLTLHYKNNKEILKWNQIIPYPIRKQFMLVF